jgi:hypothetical protein
MYANVLRTNRLLKESGGNKPCHLSDRPALVPTAVDAVRIG